ncbi:MAG: family 10 glycosylhydrolase [Firmicutes bacterium]|nr:family 10 glycosylhydrolase [Bacillota bacterium]
MSARMGGGRLLAALGSIAILTLAAVVGDVSWSHPAAATAAPLPALSPAAPEPAWQLRGIWIDNGYLARLDGRPGVARLMDQLVAAGFNAVFVESLYRGYTLYPGPYQDGRFAAWGEDPLRVVVEEARARGLSVHAWMWMLGAAIHAGLSPLLEAHPQWADRSASGDLFASGGSRMAWLDPSRPEVRRWLAGEAARLATAYGLDGIHLDYIRYNDELRDPFGYSEHAQAAFRDATGIDVGGRSPSELGPDESDAWKRWREAQVTAVVRAVRDAVEAAAPDVILSAAVLPERRQARLMHLQDWVSWLADGLVDLAIPMAYTSSTANLRDLLASVSGELEELAPWRSPDRLRARVVPGLALFATRPDTLLEQMGLVRGFGFGGVVLVSTASLRPPFREALAAGPFAGPGARPARLRHEMAALPGLPPQAMPAPEVAPAPAGPPPGANLARTASVAGDSSFRGYSPAPLNDGRRNDVPEVGRWAEAAWASAERASDHWIELRWATDQTISQVDIFWALDRGRLYPSSRLRVEVWLDQEQRWQTVWAYEAEPSDRVARTSVTFVPVTTRALRLYQPAGGGALGRPDLMWVAEVEVYGPAASHGPAPADGPR